MGFLSKLLQGISFVPTIVHGVEGLFGSKSGTDKRAAALSFVESADHPQSALFGGRPLAARCIGDAGFAARRRPARRRDLSGVHAQRRRRHFLRRVAARAANRLRPPLLSLVVGPALSPQAGDRRVHRPGAWSSCRSTDLDAGQIAFRREMRANFGNRAPEEYAEDPESCFLASGDCVFDCDVLDERLKQPRRHVGVNRQRQAAHVLPARRRRSTDHSQALHHRRRPRWRRFRRRLRLRRSYRPQQRSAVRRVARPLHATRTSHWHRQELAREYNNALVAVERNNHGHAVLAHLLHLHSHTSLYQHCPG